ncbi:hypothetical protein ACS0KN_002219 [Vibrio cholerae]|uniref:hypothetical protein n=1 Tax=Vibrio cholerae TaxID=666 RepID=UPI0011D424E9|nr:hypothetical protein [Vibrio cholerae]EGQ7789040.1 hypothetical protein [Vibrio cholerae]EGR0785443.1 hypothetical protein [Vibrio cholerae]EJL6549869.1 hypothetical protein [Vibrio cholerae]EJL6876817.1 hypothetical protein [Vibrio cholerae]EJR3663244.1 hypothetical protein [Vibrio cholerae]
MKNIIIIDDDIFTKVSDLSHCDFFKLISDEYNNEFKQTQEYLIKTKGNKYSDVDNTLEFIHSFAFIDEIFLNQDYARIFVSSDQTHTLFEQAEIEVKSRTKAFQPFLDCFSDQQKFTVEKRNQRPINASELENYDIIIMDMYMGDDYDNNIKGLAEYLGGLFSETNTPGIFLISSRDELEDLKITFRKEAKISSLSFSILNKETDLRSSSALTQIQLAYSQMCKAGSASVAIRDLSKALESAISDSASTLVEQLWSLDYPYIHQMHACTSNENVPFTDHLLSVLTNRLQFSLEANQLLSENVGNLEKNIKVNNEKYCSYSKESPIAMHDFEASSYFTGAKLSLQSLPFSLLDNLSNNPAEIPYRIPFGLVLAKASSVNAQNKIVFEDGADVLLNCTQQCDLSRNIIKDGINLILVQGKLSKAPSSYNYSLPLPTILDSLYQRWWINIDEKKIMAKPLYELVRFLVFNSYAPISIARESVVRQIRSLAFDNMSRNEASVKAGHNDLFSIRLVKYNKAGGYDVVEYKDSSNQLKPVLLYKFPDGTRPPTYHLLDQEHVEVINWVNSHCPEITQKLSETTGHDDLESVFKNKLPKLGKKNTISVVNFFVSEEQNIVEKAVTQQTPFAIQFSMI